jgi:hypothetical protein
MEDQGRNGRQDDLLRAPPLAGVATYEEAATIGLSVDESVRRLHRYAYLEAAIVRLLAARLCGTPEWEVKGALSLHCWYDAEHTGLIAQRVSEMREPPPDVFRAPNDALHAFVEELLRPHDTTELLAGVYGLVKPALRDAYRRHIEHTNPIAAHPTRRLLRLILADEEESIAWGERALAALVQGKKERETAQAWQRHLAAYLAAAGGLDGDATEASAAAPAESRASEAFTVTVDPARDHAGTEFPFDLMLRFRRPDVSAQEASWASMYDRVREMDAVELVAPLVALEGKPWDYVREMARQLWDEARHSMMGEVAFERVGANWREIPIPVIQSRAPNTVLSPLECHLLLWDIEQSLMPRQTGKGRQRDIAEAAGDPLGYQNQDYDWADEVLHVQIGRRWLVPEFGSRKKMQEVVDACNERLRKLGLDTALYDEAACDWWDSFYEGLRQLEATAGPPKDLRRSG